MQDERCVAGDGVESTLVSGWTKFGRLVRHKIGNVDAAPFALRCVPPDQFLSFAPGLSGRFGARSIIYNTAVGPPDEAPPLTQTTLSIARRRHVHVVPTP